MDINIIRSVVLLVAGLSILFFPKKVYAFQIYLIRKLRIKYEVKSESIFYFPFGVVLVIASVIAFVFSISG